MFSPFFTHFVHNLLNGFFLDMGNLFLGSVMWYFFDKF